MDEFLRALCNFLSKVRPLFVSVDTPRTPVVPPVPIWSVPPEFRLIVP